MHWEHVDIFLTLSLSLMLFSKYNTISTPTFKLLTIQILTWMCVSEDFVRNTWDSSKLLISTTVIIPFTIGCLKVTWSWKTLNNMLNNYNSFTVNVGELRPAVTVTFNSSSLKQYIMCDRHFCLSSNGGL